MSSFKSCCRARILLKSLSPHSSGGESWHPEWNLDCLSALSSTVTLAWQSINSEFSEANSLLLTKYCYSPFSQELYCWRNDTHRSKRLQKDSTAALLHKVFKAEWQGLFLFFFFFNYCKIKVFLMLKFCMVIDFTFEPTFPLSGSKSQTRAVWPRYCHCFLVGSKRCSPSQRCQQSHSLVSVLLESGLQEHGHNGSLRKL